MDDLNQSLDRFAVPEQEKSELIAIVESTRSAVVAEAGHASVATAPAEVL
jgi:hypothetical protein